LGAAALGRIGGVTPGARLASLRGTLEGRIVFTTSFGLEDQAISRLIFTQRLAIDVVTLDTGRLFPSTYALWAETEQRYGTRIRPFFPDPRQLADLIADWGINGFYHAREARSGCCGVRKVEPLRRALGGAAGWITGLRADQSGQRGAVDFAAWDETHRLIKLAPLFDCTREMVADFCASNDVPTNKLHDQGYLSIGCEPCTRAVAPGESERAGRWWWESDDAKECGLHVGTNGRLVRAKVAA